MAVIPVSYSPQFSVWDSDIYPDYPLLILTILIQTLTKSSCQ
ncbi:Uncharacterized protein dnl_58890 [Desulfonema limicola]|uniref:Uncharacterized protein n=1 Tax=Desulfonema limicola TaxID=45656 RepID=A0A975BD64_9BACT|nr:Uncharacterized protein dnl_58890 [Desulfonema limicola]